MPHETKQKQDGQSNLTYGRIAATHERFSRIRQVAPMWPPYIESQKLVAMQRLLAAGYRQYLHLVGRPLKHPP